MANEQKIMIFSSGDENEVNRAAEYLKNCNLDCTVEKPADDQIELWIDEKDKDKALRYLEDVLPRHFSQEGMEEEEDEEEWDETETETTGTGMKVLGILGILLALATIIMAIVGYTQKIPSTKIISIVLVSLTVIINGIVGIKGRKTLATLLFVLGIIGVFIFIILPDPPSETKSSMNLAMTYMNAKNYPAALQNFEKALEEARRDNDKQSEVFILSYMANIFKERSLIDKSLEYYQKALDLLDKDIEFLRKIIEPEMQRIKEEYGK